MNLFAITRGQFSMIDAILACLDQVGEARVSVWTWCIAEYEVQCFDRLRQDGRITDGLLVIDGAARKKNLALIQQWRAAHGPASVKYTVNHAKIATIETPEFRILLRGSMNLNYNPRFEQFDISEGHPGFDLVREVEAELPVLADEASYSRVRDTARLNDAWTQEELAPFFAPKVWAK
jgi:hypothetical protein